MSKPEIGILYKDNSNESKLWKYYIFIDERKMFIIDEGFKSMGIRNYDRSMVDTLINNIFIKIDVNKLDIRRKTFLIKNVLNNDVFNKDVS